MSCNPCDHENHESCGDEECSCLNEVCTSLRAERLAEDSDWSNYNKYLEKRKPEDPFFTFSGWLNQRDKTQKAPRADHGA
jgi:hypothetical protein